MIQHISTLHFTRVEMCWIIYKPYNIARLQLKSAELDPSKLRGRDVLDLPKFNIFDDFRCAGFSKKKLFDDVVIQSWCSKSFGKVLISIQF